jgi:hypothetical protein
MIFNTELLVLPEKSSQPSFQNNVKPEIVQAMNEVNVEDDESNSEFSVIPKS